MSQPESRGNSQRLAGHRERREGKQAVLHTSPTDWRIIDYGCRNNANIQLRRRMLHSTLAHESAAVRLAIFAASACAAWRDLPDRGSARERRVEQRRTIFSGKRGVGIRRGSGFVLARYLLSLGIPSVRTLLMSSC